MTSEVLQALEKQRHYQKLMTFTVRSVQREKHVHLWRNQKGYSRWQTVSWNKIQKSIRNRRLCLTLAKN